MNANRNPEPKSAEAFTAELVGEMALALSSAGTNLDDESAVLRALTNARYRSGDIVALFDLAIYEARRRANVAAEPEWDKDRTWGGR